MDGVSKKGSSADALDLETSATVRLTLCPDTPEGRESPIVLDLDIPAAVLEAAQIERLMRKDG